MNILKRLKNKKLVKRFIELDEKNKELEDKGCLKRSCASCYLLTRLNEHISTCPHERNGDEMLEIYKKLFPNEPAYAYTWRQKVKKVKELLIV